MCMFGASISLHPSQLQSLSTLLPFGAAYTLWVTICGKQSPCLLTASQHDDKTRLKNPKKTLNEQEHVPLCMCSG